MAKIKFNNWKPAKTFSKHVSGYMCNDGFYWQKSISLHGRSTGLVKCPCCESITDIYIWSFCGSGKRCGNCNVFLGSSGAFIMHSEITKNVAIETLKEETGNHKTFIFKINH